MNDIFKPEITSYVFKTFQDLPLLKLFRKIRLLCQTPVVLIKRYQFLLIIDNEKELFIIYG